MTPTHVRMMTAHGGWMNGRMPDLCGTLPDTARKRGLGAFFKSVHGTFDHLIYGDLAWTGRLTESWLAETISLPRWVLVTHMFDHATHHRGQLTTLMKQLGVEPGVTDLPWLPALYDGTVLRATQM
jgi:uncharacterized damage-inducible protein DinB